MKPTGYMVVECCEDFEQILTLCTGGILPSGGVLHFANKAPRAVFTNRADAVSAINRTENYRLAFGYTHLPEKKFCKVVPVATVGAIK